MDEIVRSRAERLLASLVVHRPGEERRRPPGFASPEELREAARRMFEATAAVYLDLGVVTPDAVEEWRAVADGPADTEADRIAQRVVDERVRATERPREPPRFELRQLRRVLPGPLRAGDVVIASLELYDDATLIRWLVPWEPGQGTSPRRPPDPPQIGLVDDVGTTFVIEYRGGGKGGGAGTWSGVSLALPAVPAAARRLELLADGATFELLT